jgi:hypothetical protein
MNSIKQARRPISHSLEVLSTLTRNFVYAFWLLNISLLSCLQLLQVARFAEIENKEITESKHTKVCLKLIFPKHQFGPLTNSVAFQVIAIGRWEISGNWGCQLLSLLLYCVG